FEDSLQPNTTYTIDFGSAIEDNNEGNVLENFSYTFSTGETLDTLRIAGMVLSADRLEPMQRKLVGVHRNMADSAFRTLRFDRMARTDDRGRFSIEGLSAGEYRVYALDDMDGNLRYSSPEEEMAFYEVTVTPTVTEGVAIDSIYNLKTERLDTVVKRVRAMYLPNDILLRSFKTDRRQQFISSYNRVDSTRLDIVMGAPGIRMPRFSVVGAPDMERWNVCERSATNDTISLWLSRQSLVVTDTLRISVDYEKLDSLNNYITMSDTLRFVTNRPRAPKKNVKKHKEAETDTVATPVRFMEVSMKSGSTLEYGQPIIIETESPVMRMDSTAFHLEERRDTLWVEVGKGLPERLDTLNPRRYKIDVPLGYGKEYRLRIDSLGMESIYGLHTAPREFTARQRAKDDYSSLTVRVSGVPDGTPAFVELLQNDDAVSRRVTLEGGIAKFENLVPGKYYMRLYLDYNGNGRFDTGDYHLQRQPEQVFYYPKQLNIKQNWEKEEGWNILDTPMNLQKPSALLKNKPTLKRGEKERSESDEEDEEDYYGNSQSGSSGRNLPGRTPGRSSSKLRGL
ncbi:MAG: Ig-like domain-containing protein, partial [Muribaculaceae bacterium]|nr:Ig-like domain-containing protein [Muribaculaceae bacterium]